MQDRTTPQSASNTLCNLTQESVLKSPNKTLDNGVIKLSTVQTPRTIINYHHNILYINYLINYQRLQNAKTTTTIAKLTDSLSLKYTKRGVLFD